MYPSITVTIPKEILSDKIVQDSIAQVMVKKTAPEVYGMFKGTVEGWSNKPAFRRKLKRGGSYMSMTVWATGTNVNQYELVNQGADPHPIPKTGTTFMRFPHGSGYKASTAPRILKSGPRSNSGEMIVKFKVDHPGFKAREFDKTIAKEYEPTFRKDIQDAIGVAAAKSNK